MKYKYLVFLFCLLTNTQLIADNYFKALDLFNKKKITESIQLFQKVAVDNKNKFQDKALFNLAIIYDNGYGVNADKTKALYYYNEASELNNEYAMYNLAWMYQVGENVNKDAVKAFKLYTKSADKGHPQALFNLANMYYSGVGTTKNLKQAYKLFLESKIKGVVESNYYIEKISSLVSVEELNFMNEEYESIIEKKIDLPAPVEN